MGTTGRFGRVIRAATILALLGGMAACSGSGSDSGVSVDSDGGGPVSDEAAPGGDASVEDSDREVIVTGSLSLRVDDALEAADEAARIVREAGGRVDDRSEQVPVDETPASAYLTVRIPADDLDDALEDLRTLGEVRELSLNRQDVTLQFTDLEARIQALEISVTRLEGLMSEAGSITELLAAEAALAERQAELDSLTAQRTYLGEQVALSTIYLSLLPKASTPAPAPGGFWGGVQTGWSALVTFFNQVLVVLGVLVPWILLAGVVLVIVWVIRRSLPKKPRPPVAAQPPRFAQPPYPGGPGVPGAPGAVHQPVPPGPAQPPPAAQQAPGAQQVAGPQQPPPAAR